MDADCERYLTEVADVLVGALGTGLVGTYLHGSAVLGGFDPRRSDLDVLAVCRERTEPDARAAIAEDLAASTSRCPAVGLEFSLVTEHAVRNLVTSPAFELHVTTAPPDAKAVDGADRDGDPDLVLHFAACRAAGRALGVGPPPAELFAPLPGRLVRAQLAVELAWGVEHGSAEYAVLNACRAWRYAVDGTLVSKIDGGRWAAQRCAAADADLVAAAIARQRGEPTAPLDQDQVTAFVAGVTARLV